MFTATHHLPTTHHSCLINAVTVLTSNGLYSFGTRLPTWWALHHLGSSDLLGNQPFGTVCFSCGPRL